MPRPCMAWPFLASAPPTRVRRGRFPRSTTKSGHQAEAPVSFCLSSATALEQVSVSLALWQKHRRPPQGEVSAPEPFVPRPKGFGQMQLIAVPPAVTTALSCADRAPPVHLVSLSLATRPLSPLFLYLFFDPSNGACDVRSWRASSHAIFAPWPLGRC